MAANSRVLLAYVNIWASDEEKSHLKHLRQTNVNEFSSYLLEVMPTLQMRQGTDWLAAYNCPVIIRKESKRPLVWLARAVLRIRTTMHADCLDYDMDGLLRTLRARVMVGILENRMRVYLQQLRLRVKFVIRRQSYAQWKAHCEFGEFEASAKKFMVRSSGCLSILAAPVGRYLLWMWPRSRQFRVSLSIHVWTQNCKGL